MYIYRIYIYMYIHTLGDTAKRESERNVYIYIGRERRGGEEEEKDRRKEGKGESLARRRGRTYRGRVVANA